MFPLSDRSEILTGGFASFRYLTACKNQGSQKCREMRDTLIRCTLINIISMPTCITINILGHRPLWSLLDYYSWNPFKDELIATRETPCLLLLLLAYNFQYFGLWPPVEPSE